jgi:hypothetical protein
VQVLKYIPGTGMLARHIFENITWKKMLKIVIEK